MLPASQCCSTLPLRSRQHPENLKRSLLFVFVTGEEKGLLGSKYFAAHPDGRSQVDGGGHQHRYVPAAGAAQAAYSSGIGGIRSGRFGAPGGRGEWRICTTDPQPLRNVFVRSDQYSFIRHGIPALALDIAPTTAEEKQIFADWLTHRYHAPSDDLDQPVDLAAAGKYEDIIRQLMIKVANDPQRPQWKQDSFFRRFAETAKN